MSRVLFLAPSVPWPPDSGGRIRTGQLLRGLRDEHEVHVWCVERPGGSNPDLEAAGELCEDLRIFPRSSRGPLAALSGPNEEGWFWSAPLARALRNRASQDFDVLHVDELSQSRLVPDTLAIPRVAHHHKLDLELSAALRPAGARRELELQRWRQLEQHSLGQTLDHVFCSEADAARFATRHPTARTHVIENGVDSVSFAPAESARESRHLLFVGSFDYAPNARGVACFLQQVWPVLRAQHADLQLSLVGRGARPADLHALPAGVTWVGAVPDVRPWFARATALVVPLAVGGGTRLKILEAAAMGCPVVSTEVGAEGLRLEPGLDFWSASSIAELAVSLDECLVARQQAAERAQRARALILEHHDWNPIARRLGDLWRSVSESSA